MKKLSPFDEYLEEIKIEKYISSIYYRPKNLVKMSDQLSIDDRVLRKKNADNENLYKRIEVLKVDEHDTNKLSADEKKIFKHVNTESTRPYYSIRSKKSLFVRPELKFEEKIIFHAYARTQCQRSELVECYNMEKRGYTGPMVILGHAVQIERELKKRIFGSCDFALEQHIISYYLGKSNKYMFLADALKGEKPITLGIISFFLRAVHDLNLYNYITQNQLLGQQVADLSEIRNAYNFNKFRILRNKANHDKVPRNGNKQFFHTTYAYSSYAELIDNAFTLPHGTQPGFFYQYLQSSWHTNPWDICPKVG